MPVSPDVAQWATIDAALAENRLIEAIRLYRELTHCSLADASQAIRARNSQNIESVATPASHSEPMLAHPDRVAAFMRSGHARPGEVWASWLSPGQQLAVLVEIAESEGKWFELHVIPLTGGHFGHDAHGYRLDRSGLERALTTGFSGAPGASPACLTELRERLRQRREPKHVQSLPVHQTTLWRLSAEHFEQRWLWLPERCPAAFWHELRETLAHTPDVSEWLSDWPASAPIAPGAVAAPLIWARCLRDAHRGSVRTNATTWFGDMEAGALRLDERDRRTFAAFAPVVDCSALRRSQLPWWWAACAHQFEASTGLLSPWEVRGLLACWSQPSETHPAAADRSALHSIVAAAAAAGDWLLGMEPGS